MGVGWGVSTMRGRTRMLHRLKKQSKSIGGVSAEKLMITCREAARVNANSKPDPSRQQSSRNNFLESGRGESGEPEGLYHMQNALMAMIVISCSPCLSE